MAQREAACDVGDTDADLQARTDLVANRWLDIDRAHIGVVAQEAAGEVIGVPFGFETVGGIQADARGKLGIDLMGDVDVGDGDDRVLEIATGAEEIIGKTAVRRDERSAHAQAVTAHAGESGRIKEDRRAVRTRSRCRDAGPAHGARTLLVHAKPLRHKQRGGDERMGSGEQQQRKPPHNVFSAMTNLR